MILNLFRYRKKSTTKCREIHFIKAETGQQSPRQRPDGDRRSDDGKPRDSVSDTVGNMAAGGLAKRFTVGQQVFNDFKVKSHNTVDIAGKWVDGMQRPREPPVQEIT